MQTRRDYGAPRQATDPISADRASLYFHCAIRFSNPVTRVHVRLLGPCFKTGRMGNRQNTKAEHHSNPIEYLHRKAGSRGWGPYRNNANIKQYRARGGYSFYHSRSNHMSSRVSNPLPKQRNINSRSTRHSHCLWRASLGNAPVVS